MGATDHDDSLDALGDVLRAFAERTFDVENRSAVEAKAYFESWARHLLTGAAHPDDPEAGPAATRDFGGLRRAMARHRTAERDHVDHLAEVLWDVASGLRGAFSKDAVDDRAVKGQLDKLKAAATGRDVTLLRSEVVKTVVLVRRAAEERQKRHESAMRRMGRTLREPKKELSVARHDAETDKLTQLYNRAAFDAHYGAACELSQISGEPLSVLMIDVVHFKKLNDSHGHQKGDEALIEVSNAIVRVACRRGDFVARFGGEEVVVVLGDTPPEGAVKVAERICESIRKVRVEADFGEDIRVTASVGIAHLLPGELGVAALGRADRALYRAKAAGRDQAVVATEAPVSVRGPSSR